MEGKQSECTVRENIFSTKKKKNGKMKAGCINPEE